MIELVDFTKCYKNIKAVDNVSFKAENCSVTGLLGPNGAGKSTIIKAICGVHFPTTGQVLVNGIDVEKNTVEAQKLIGYVSEQAEFPTFYTVNELLNECGKMRLESKNQRNQQIEKVVNQLDLQEVFTSKVSTLSKGFKQRLSFALALIHDPKVLILDEPVSGLDPMQIVEIRQLITKLSKQKTILLSTHLMQEAKELCSNVVILHKGSLIAKGSVSEICEQTKTDDLEKAFLVLAQSNKVN